MLPDLDPGPGPRPTRTRPLVLLCWLACAAGPSCTGPAARAEAAPLFRSVASLKDGWHPSVTQEALGGVFEVVLEDERE